MAQITLYLDDALQQRLKDHAARQQVSQSQFVASLIRQAVCDQWPADVLALAGTVGDFPLATELRQQLDADAPRVL